MSRGQTPSQTIGPFFAYGLTPGQHGYAFADLATEDLLSPEVLGERIRLEGQILDGNGEPVSDAMVEIWQADAEGRLGSSEKNSDFAGFGRSSTATHPDNCFCFSTIKPGAVDDLQAPHVCLVIFMRGGLRHYHTRAYFSDCEAENDGDPVLKAIPQARRHTLIAQRGNVSGHAVYRFDIHMQGVEETVFFDLASH